MSTLLVLRERLKKIYAAYSAYILKILQLLMGLLLFGLINSNVGFMKIASSILSTVGLSVICAFFPMIVMVIAATVLILVHFYALSMPIAVVSGAIFLLMYIFYFRFSPGKAWLVLVSALAFGLKIPFVVPVVFGLMGTVVWIVPAVCGIIAFYMVYFVKASSTALQSADAEGMVEGVMSFTRQVLANKEMWLMAMAAVIGILIVNTVKNRSVDHAWKIASAAGVSACFVIAAAGNIVLGLDLSYVVMILSSVAGLAAGLILELLFFAVDYSRTEHIQFEDDEYYYYVKAVPKIGVPVPEKRVKRITERHVQEEDSLQSPDRAKEERGKSRSEKQDSSLDRTTDEILLTRSLSKELGLDRNSEEHE